jgi:hypothetical protein
LPVEGRSGVGGFRPTGRRSGPDAFSIGDFRFMEVSSNAGRESVGSAVLEGLSSAEFSNSKPRVFRISYAVFIWGECVLHRWKNLSCVSCTSLMRQKSKLSSVSLKSAHVTAEGLTGCDPRTALSRHACANRRLGAH